MKSQKFYKHVSQDIDKIYLRVIEGDNDNPGLDGQLKYMKAEFRKSKESLFDKSIELTMAGVIKLLAMNP